MPFQRNVDYHHQKENIRKEKIVVLRNVGLNCLGSGCSFVMDQINNGLKTVSGSKS